MSPAKTYGRAWLDDGVWKVQAEPHVLMRMKRVFERIEKGEHGTVSLSHSAEVAFELQWFFSRYPVEMNDDARWVLTKSAKAHTETVLRLEQILAGRYQPRQFQLALPAREYQRQAADLYLTKRSLLLADDVGLGKSACGICSFTDARTLPAVVVCYPFLQIQWRDEIKKFAPDLTVHIIRSTTPYKLPQLNGRLPDVLITTYHKLNGWAEVLSKYVKSMVADETQELRHNTSLKYQAAKFIADHIPFKLGLSATPIANYGGEMFNVLDVLSPGCLGTREEFHREWCVTAGDGKWRIVEPRAFGAYLRENFLMLRRTRADVGRELPEVTRVPVPIDSDAETMAKVEGAAAELARIIMSQSPERYDGEKLNAGGQLNSIIRQATGVAKAPYVAEFVKMLLDSGEKVLLGGWHRAVYDIWEAKLGKHYKIGYFTGTESPAEKERIRELFVRGEIDCMFMSLRAGAGLNQLQEVCRVAVIGELDWSPSFHEQFIGRLQRDGQLGSVTAYFMISNAGADPLMAEKLGIKSAQINGIRSPKQDLVEKLDVGGAQVRRLAEMYLKRNGRPVPAHTPPPPPRPLVEVKPVLPAPARRRFIARLVTA